MSLADIRTALKDAATGIPNLKGLEYEADNINPVVAQVGLRGARYADVMGTTGDTVYTFAVTVFAGRIAEIQAQKTLDTFVDADDNSAIKTAFEAPSVSSAAGAQYITVNTASVGPATVGQIEYLAAEFEVEVVV